MKESVSIMSGAELYKQEGRVGFYQLMLPYQTAGKPMLQYIPVTWGESFAWFKDNYLVAVFYEENFHKIVKEVLKLSAGRSLPTFWRAEWQRLDGELSKASRVLVSKNLGNLSLEELKVLYDEVYELDQAMWSVLIFIDTFDAGFDQVEIEQIAKERGFSELETHTLLTPSVPAFVTGWELALHKLTQGEISREELKQSFFWYGMDYSSFKEVDDGFIEAELEKLHPVVFEDPTEAQQAILKKHGLMENPLSFFNELTIWRDERKRLNYTGLYGLVKILREVCRRQGIDPELVNGLLPNQVDDFFAGNISAAQLKKQVSEGIFLHVTENDEYLYYFGSEAAEKWSVVSKALNSLEGGELKGMVASKGKAQGVVRVVLDPKGAEAQAFQKGEVLITSMTRPEFMGLMKLSSAIVTDEGGITSHAAIVSRELGKPCIIGTRTASTALKTGDLVEVDAEKGIVRIL